MQCLLRAGAAAAVVGALLLLGSCDWGGPGKGTSEAGESAPERALAKKLQAACSSPATYDRLKQIAFEEAIRIRNADPVNLDTLAAHAFVRVEQPRVVSRDETLDVTVCEGRFILQLPPGAERAFSGEHQLAADIEYAAQAAADGSGLVYQIKGAEPIIYKLAAFDLKNQAASGRVAAAEPTPPPPRPATAPDVPASTQPPAAPPPPLPPRAAPAAQPVEARAPQQAAGQQSSRPSFNCRYARTRTEKMVCSSEQLAALDRAMSSMYYSALSEASGSGRAMLRRTRDQFLAMRERCPSESCVAQAYRERVAEIRSVASEH